MYEISPDYMPHNEPIRTYKWGTERNLFFLALVLVMSVLVFRRPDAFLIPQFHAEEGRNFFADAYNQGWSSLFNTVNGYFHVFPRLVILLSLSFTITPAYLPTVYLVVTIACYLGLVFFIFKRFPGTPWQKFFASLVVFFVPLGNEILMNQTNIQWFGALFLYLLFFFPSQKPHWLLLLPLLFFSFTGPFALLLLPLVAVKYFRTPDSRLPAPYYLILLCSSFVTLYSLISYGSIDRTDGEFTLFDKGFVQHFFFQYTFFIFSKFVHDVPFWLMVVGAIVVLFFFFALFAKGRGRHPEKHRRVREISSNVRVSHYLLATSLWFLVITFISYRFDPGALSPFYCAIRNYFLPAVFLFWALIIHYGNSRFFIPLSAFIVLWFFLQTFLFIEPYRFEDMNWKEQVKEIKGQDSTIIPINPKGWNLVLKKGKHSPE